MLKYHRGLKKIKVGHAGTLDPLATGLLIVCTGRKTKTINDLIGLEKEYSGTIKLGATTPSYDAETEVDQTFSIGHITKEMLLDTAKNMEGSSQQLPPAYSALQVNGVRAYKMARAGKVPKLKHKDITIKKFKLTDIKLPEVDFQIECSKGTYIRSIAFDYGRKLGSGAFLSRLKRDRIGEFKLCDAIELQELEDQLKSSALQY